MTAKKPSGQPSEDRRSFLKGMGLAGAAAAAPPLAGLGATEAQALAAPPQQRAARYQESEHIKKYYWTNRR